MSDAMTTSCEPEHMCGYRRLHFAGQAELKEAKDALARVEALADDWAAKDSGAAIDGILHNLAAELRQTIRDGEPS